MPHLTSSWLSAFRLPIRNDHETAGALDDSLGLRPLVAGKDNEAGIDRPDSCILRGAHFERVSAREVAALAQEQAHAGLVPLSQLGDPLVYLTQKALIASG